MTDTDDAPTVLFVSLPGGRGGSVRSLLTVLAGLDDTCRRVVARPPATTTARHLATEGLADTSLDLAPPGGRASRIRSTLTLARWTVRHRRTLVAVHANGLSELMLAAPAMIVARRPIVVWVHDWEVSTRQRRFARAVGPLVTIRWATVSEANRDALDADGVARGAPIRVIPNPIEPPRSRAAFTSGPSAPTVAYVGAPARYKGFDLLPSVIDRVATLAPEVRWEIWSGPRDQLPEVFDALLARGDRVTLHDKTADVDDAYGSAHVVFCPSRAESFGRVAAEAMAHGRAVVASDLPALREVVGAAGLLVPPGDVDAAATALASVVTDPARRRDLGEAGLREAERFRPEPVTRALAALYGIATGPGRALVVSHEATRTGAPAVAVEVAAALRRAGWRVEVALRADGPLRNRLGRNADDLTIEPVPRARAAIRRAHRLRPLANRLDERVAARVIDRTRPDLVWVNTVLATSYVRPARARGIPVVVHVHELGALIPRVLGRHQLAEPTVPDPGIRWVAASTECAAQLDASVSIAAPVAVLESAIDVAAVQARAAEPSGRRWDGPSGRAGRTLLVGACGRPDERKGVDLWLDVARIVHARRPTARFVWIGEPRREDREAVARRALDHVVRFTGELANPAPTMATFDVFTLPSRSETFPLVVLEAMALARPVVAFDTGGVGRQLGGVDTLAPAGDVQAFAEGVLALLDDPDRARELGAAGRDRVAATFGIDRFHEAVQAIAASSAMTREP